MVRIALEQELDVNQDSTPTTIITPETQRPMLLEAEVAAQDYLKGRKHVRYQPLYLAANRGDWKSAKRIIDDDPSASAARITSESLTTLMVAARASQWRFAQKLLEDLPSESLETVDLDGRTLLHYAALAGSLETAMALIRKNSALPQIPDNNGWVPLYLSFSNKQLLRYLILDTRDEHPCFPFTGPLSGLFVQFLIDSGYYALPLKQVREEKLKHVYAVELVNHICKQVFDSKTFEETMEFFNSPGPFLPLAAEVGIVEFIRTCLQYFPDLIFVDNLLQVAIEYRQAKIFNLIKEMPAIALQLNLGIQESGTTLHLVAKLAPSSQLLSVSGSALQMQRELQWFKEVEKITLPGRRGRFNAEGITAKDLFTKEHKELAAVGEKWMKDTANSGMIVTTLIATVLLAAAFTVPGGNNDAGIPIFLHETSFLIFVVSDALALFSSITSLLMFLSILTARYAEEDFLRALPKRLILGLGSLFFTIASMMVVFGATLSIVLSEKWQWAFIPIVFLASIPVAIFAMLQLPLFIQMINSTYGTNIFQS
ncbi:hypothetical protein LWI28_029005 [Acer negundo]|uniref:PGG domain-containing protein n=1 Tax=Acer negundo TaxID=4023 RepID=A0AAD5JC02_ACENE|nr:hypothetical protein LWI28_029005 [Acer negundo]